MHNALSVASISTGFFSIPSTESGVPCVTVRLAGCDLLSENLGGEGAIMEIDAIEEKARSLGGGTVAITGGETLEQEATSDLARRFISSHKVIVETNATRDIGCLPEPIIRIAVIPGPSYRMSGRINWFLLGHLRPNDNITFLIADRADYEWAREIIEKHDIAGACHILVTPVTVNPRILGNWILFDNMPIRLSLPLEKALAHWPLEKKQQ